MSLYNYLLKRDTHRINYSLEDLHDEVGTETDYERSKFNEWLRKELGCKHDLTPTHYSCRTARNIICSWLTEI